MEYTLFRRRTGMLGARTAIQAKLDRVFAEKYNFNFGASRLYGPC